LTREETLAHLEERGLPLELIEHLRKAPVELAKRGDRRDRVPDRQGNEVFSLAENASAGAAMAGPSLPRPLALHQLHLGRTGPIGPERRQYDLLNPRVAS
jgi:hypothetical protein